MRTRTSGRAQNRRNARKAKQQSTSIYFLLWATFTAFSLIIVFFLSLSQGILLSRTYRNQASQEIYTKGRHIQRLLTTDMPPSYEENRTAYLRFLATQYDVNIFILSEDGEVLLPEFPENPDGTFDYTQEIVEFASSLFVKINLSPIEINCLFSSNNRNSMVLLPFAIIENGCG